MSRPQDAHKSSPEDALASLEVAIVGHTGLVGGTLLDHLPRAICFNSKNIRDIVGKCFDVVICCGLPAAKWRINQYPDEDSDNMRLLQDCLAQAQCTGRFVLVSTIDVYDTGCPGQTEEVAHPASHPYGRHRRQMEDWAVHQFGADRCAIVRLPGLFGIGLKKNIIYDLLNDNMVEAVCCNHVFQWYDLADLYKDICNLIFPKKKDRLAQKVGGPTVLNLFTEPLSTAELVAHAFPEHWPSIRCNVADVAVVYKICTKHTSSGYIADKETVLGKISTYVSMQRKKNCGLGRLLAISNLAWPPEHEDHAMRLLAKYGIGSVEVAPTRHAPWDDENQITKATAAVLRHGLSVCSLQAVFFGKDCSLFDEEEKGAADTQFELHFKHVIRLASQVGAKAIVFGSPRNRQITGTGLSLARALDRAVAVFRRILHAAELIDPDVLVCFEPNSAKYGCDFVVTAAQALELVHRVGHPQFKLNLDTGNAHMEGECPAGILKAAAGLDNSFQSIGHVQISMPYLAPLQVDAGEARLLRSNLKDRVFSLEMKEVAGHQLPSVLAAFYAYV